MDKSSPHNDDVDGFVDVEDDEASAYVVASVVVFEDDEDGSKVVVVVVEATSISTFSIFPFGSSLSVPSLLDLVPLDGVVVVGLITSGIGSSFEVLMPFPFLSIVSDSIF